MLANTAARTQRVGWLPPFRPRPCRWSQRARPRERRPPRAPKPVYTLLPSRGARGRPGSPGGTTGGPPRRQPYKHAGSAWPSARPAPTPPHARTPSQNAATAPHRSRAPLRLPPFPMPLLPLRPLLAARPHAKPPTLSQLAARNHIGPRRSLAETDRDTRLMREWGVPTLPHPACLTFGRLESAVARSARRGPAPQTPHPTGPPPNIIHANILTSGRLRTLATGRSNHPWFLDPPTFFSTQTLMQVHGSA